MGNCFKNAVLTVLVAMLGCFGGLALAQPTPIRGVWVAGPQHNSFWKSPQHMAEHMAAFHRVGINTVYLATLNHGRTYYPSAVMQAVVGEPIAKQFAGRDPLAEAIAAAKPHNIRVLAWMEFGFASHHGQSGVSNTLLSAKPQWAALNRQGQPVVKNQFAWMNAFDAEVQNFMTELLVEVAQNYPELAGVQGDDRLPALPAEAGHNPAVLATYTQATGQPVPSNDRDPAWVQWRADQLTAYLGRLRSALKAARPNITLSLAPSPAPWGFVEYLQDWPAWVRLGLADEIIPQLYRREAPAYERLATQTKALFDANAAKSSRPAPAFAGGMLLSLGQQTVVTPQVLRDIQAVNRKLGIAGEVFFHSIGIETLAAP